MERAPLSEPTPPPPKPASTKQRPSGVLRMLRNMVATVVAVGLLGAVGAAAFAYHKYEVYSADLPSVEGLRHYQPRVMSRVYAGDSRLISELATERRIFVPVGAIPELVKQAFLAAEDQKFWSHRGVDPFAIARAGMTDLLQYGSGKRPVGASTITQQVAKNMLLGNEVSIARKVRELILAVRIDESMSKEHVLELYLNEIYLGLQAYGVAAAGQAYFSKGLDELTAGEAAFLAALPKAPNNYNPFTKADAAKARRDWVLDRMTETKALTAQQAAAAKAEPIRPAPFRRPRRCPAPNGSPKKCVAKWSKALAPTLRQPAASAFAPASTPPCRRLPMRRCGAACSHMTGRMAAGVARWGTSMVVQRCGPTGTRSWRRSRACRASRRSGGWRS